MSVVRYGVDLHMHTSYSDGLDTPEQLVHKAAQQALRSIAITDHDSVAAFPEAQRVSHLYGVEVLPGVELSVQYQEHDDIHILGYLFDPDHESLLTRLGLMQQHRVQRGLEILARINARLTQSGRAPLSRERVLQRAQGALTRPHLAHELVAQGYVGHLEEAFQQFLIPCDVPKARLAPEEAFALMAQAGGICSLAHPGIISADPAELETLLQTFKAMGLAGVEAYHHCHDPAYIDFFLTCARRYGLIVTGGSDYHGRQDGTGLGQFAPGQAIPDHVLIDLRKAHVAVEGGIGLTALTPLC
jgi:predicted metal-dependent phosphoesterase TrpH